MAFIKKRRPWDSQPQEAPTRSDGFFGQRLLQAITPHGGIFGAVTPVGGVIAGREGIGVIGGSGAYLKSLVPADRVLGRSTGFPAANRDLTLIFVVSDIGTDSWLYDGQSDGAGTGWSIKRDSSGNLYAAMGISSNAFGTVAWPADARVILISSGRYNSAVAPRVWFDGVGTDGTLSYQDSWATSPTFQTFFGSSAYPSANTFVGKGYLAGAIRGLLDDRQARILTDGIWQELFTPRTIWVPVSAGGGTPTLTVPDSSHAHTLDNVALTSSTALAAQDISHAHTLDNVALSTTGATALTVADLDHAHALDSLVLTSEAYLVAADMLHAHALDGVTVTLDGTTLTVAELLHAHALDNTALTLDTYLAVADALHAHTLDNVALSTPGGTLDLILKILANRQELNPATGTFTLYDNDGTTVLYTTSAWADAAGTVPYSGGALRRIDALF